MIAYLDDFIEENGFDQAKVERLDNDASRRVYYRVSNGQNSYILCDSSQDLKALQKTIHTNQIFAELGVKVPKIISVDSDQGYMLIEDFGDKILNKIITPTNRADYYKKLLSIIYDMQAKTVGKELPLDPYNNERLNKELMKFCDYFLERVLPIQELAAARDELLAIFEQEMYPKLESSANAIVHRDFHVDNLVLCSDGQIGVIDFQDAVVGSVAYDVVCLLQDARRYVSQDFEAEMLDYFLSISKYDRKSFIDSYNALGLQKNLKIIGIFSNLYHNEGRSIYHERCDVVWEYIKRCLPSAPALEAWCDKFRIIKHHEEL